MKIGSSTILVTGGATGIGLALAERFVAAGSQVVVCGRRADALRAAQEKVPALACEVADLARAADREALIARVVARFPKLNVLVNNAGIQRRARFSDDAAPWAERQQEIAINLEAPLHLTALLLPHLRQQPDAAVVNVSSGLAFVPATFASVYSATKAALHSFTVTLRHDLARAGAVEVIEIVPPAVDTDLGGKGLHTQGVPLAEFADAVVARIAAGETEIGYGFSDQARRATRDELDAISARLAQQQ
jgi:uncharacterized oxidoreductase